MAILKLRNSFSALALDDDDDDLDNSPSDDHDNLPSDDRPCSSHSDDRHNLPSDDRDKLPSDQSDDRHNLPSDDRDKLPSDQSDDRPCSSHSDDRHNLPSDDRDKLPSDDRPCSSPSDATVGVSDAGENRSSLGSSSEFGGSASEKLEVESGSTGDQKSGVSMLECERPLVWIDLEMTGLDVSVDRILEIACIITDDNLEKIVEGPNLVIHQSAECLIEMNDWCKVNHRNSGLTKRVLKSKISEREAEKEVIEFVKKHVDDTQKPNLAGNSVYMDYMFLKKYMPELAKLFPHVLVDVSSVVALCLRWYPDVKKKAPEKMYRHRAMDDIKESIMELKYYKDNIFIAPEN